MKNYTEIRSRTTDDPTNIDQDFHHKFSRLFFNLKKFGICIFCHIVILKGSCIVMYIPIILLLFTRCFLHSLKSPWKKTHLFCEFPSQNIFADFHPFFRRQKFKWKGEGEAMVSSAKLYVYVCAARRRWGHRDVIHKKVRGIEQIKNVDVVFFALRVFLIRIPV